MTRIPMLAVALSLAFTACALAQTAEINASNIAKTIQTISSDAYEGRGPATRAEKKTTEYIAAQFAAAGLQPAGPNGSWLQPVPLARFEINGPVKMSFTLAGTAKNLTQGEEAVVQTLMPVNRVAIANAPLVFVGYGVKANECGWDDFKGVDLKGKIAVVLVNDPDFESPLALKSDGCFGGLAMTYYGRWTYKYEEAARQGALGMLIVHETAPAAYGWATVRNSNSNAQFDIVREDAGKAHPLVQGWIQRDMAIALFKAAGLEFEAQKRAAQSRDFQPVVLKNTTFSADYAVQASQIVSANVAGRVVGQLRPNETVIYSAHWDHLGIGAPDAKGDRIFNGALDNATGVAALIEMARVYAKAPPPGRSVLFLAVTAEEKGLLGSAYYAAHPLFPLATTVADINMDGFKADGRSHDLSTSGSGKTNLEDNVKALLTGSGRYFTVDPEPEKGHFYRSDHFSFARVGVPAISVESGTDLLKGGTEAGIVWREEYVKNRYHQPADEWDAKWDLSGVVEDVGLLYTLGWRLANSKAWPAWNPDTEFKTLRDQSVNERR